MADKIVLVDEITDAIIAREKMFKESDDQRVVLIQLTPEALAKFRASGKQYPDIEDKAIATVVPTLSTQSADGSTTAKASVNSEGYACIAKEQFAADLKTYFTDENLASGKVNIRYAKKEDGTILGIRVDLPDYSVDCPESLVPAELKSKITKAITYTKGEDGLYRSKGEASGKVNMKELEG